MLNHLPTNVFENVGDLNNIESSAVNKLDKDLRQASQELTTAEARFLVDYYYQLQDDRIRAKNQVRKLSESSEPNEVIGWLSDNTAVLEKQIGAALAKFAEANYVGKWALSICGIGPVIAAGLLAHIDIEKAHNVGHILSFAGMLPNPRKWEKGMKRPFNAKLKVLCWKIGESFVKVSNNKNDFYGKIYKRAKQVYIEKNERGELAKDANLQLTVKKYGKDTEAYKYYSGQYHPLILNAIKEANNSSKHQFSLMTVKECAGYVNEKHPLPESVVSALAHVQKYNEVIQMLPPAHIHERAKRKAVSLFLSHWWEVAFRHTFPDRECPRPYALDHLGHKDFIDIPNNPFK